jgi:hypothetical protein
MDKASLGIG